MVKLVQVCGTLTNCKELALRLDSELQHTTKRSDKLNELQTRARTRLRALKE